MPKKPCMVRKPCAEKRFGKAVRRPNQIPKTFFNAHRASIHRIQTDIICGLHHQPQRVEHETYEPEQRGRLAGSKDAGREASCTCLLCHGAYACTYLCRHARMQYVCPFLCSGCLTNYKCIYVHEYVLTPPPPADKPSQAKYCRS